MDIWTRTGGQVSFLGCSVGRTTRQDRKVQLARSNSSMPYEPGVVTGVLWIGGPGAAKRDANTGSADS